MGWFRSNKEEEWLKRQRQEERARIREREMEEELQQKRRLKKQNALAGAIVAICCIVALAITYKFVILDERSVVGNQQPPQTVEAGAVLKASWKGLLNQGVIQQERISKIIFLDLNEEKDVSMDAAINEVYHPKDKNESAAGSGDVCMWAEDIGGKYVLYIAAEGGVWAPKDSRELFSYCENLETIEFNGAFHTENTENMRAMFLQCSSMTDLDVSCFDTSQVTDMGWMFSQCSALTELDVSGFETGKVTDMSDMFADCAGVTELDVSGFDTGCAVSISGMFAGCRSLRTIDVSSFDTSQVTDMSYMFADCPNLTALELSGFTTDNLRFQGMDGIFMGCTKLESVGNIVIPEGSDPYTMDIYELLERGMPAYDDK